MGVYLTVYGGYDQYGCHHRVDPNDQKTMWPSDALKAELKRFAVYYNEEDCAFVMSFNSVIAAFDAILNHPPEGYEDMNGEDDQMIKHILSGISGNSGYDMYDFYRLEWH